MMDPPKCLLVHIQLHKKDENLMYQRLFAQLKVDVDSTFLSNTRLHVSLKRCHWKHIVSTGGLKSDSFYFTHSLSCDT